MSQQQAGWYPDPSGDTSKLRYWNGSQWTNDFSDFPQTSQPIEPAQAISPYQPHQAAQSTQQHQRVQPPIPIQYPPYGYPSSGQPVYPQPQYYAQAPAQQYNGLAIASFVCGIIGICVSCSFVVLPFSVTATVLGALGRTKPGNRGLANAGLALGIAESVIGMLFFVILLTFY